MNYYAGTHTAELDTKGRVVIPKDFRNVPPKEIREGKLFFSPNTDEKCIDVYPEPVWETRIHQIRQSSQLTVGEADELIGLLYGGSYQTKIDDYNRLALTHPLRQHLGVDNADGNVTLAFVGRGSNFRIHVAAEYEQQDTSRGAREKELLAKYFSGSNREAFLAGDSGEG